MAKSRALVSAAKSVLGAEGGGRKPEKENMAEFIAKKREMFLVQVHGVHPLPFTREQNSAQSAMVTLALDKTDVAGHETRRDPEA